MSKEKIKQFKAFSIYAMTQEGQGMQIILNDAEQVFVIAMIEKLHGGVIKAIKRDLEIEKCKIKSGDF